MFQQRFARVYILLNAILNVQSDPGCLYGWQMSSDNQTCIINCANLNINCQLKVLRYVNTTYDANSGTLSMPVGKHLAAPPRQFKAAKCYTVTLSAQQYKITPNNELDIGRKYVPVRNYRLKSDRTVTFCYPLSPQLLQCDTQRTRRGSYDVVNGTELRVPEKNITAYLGDFYVAENGDAITCNETINILDIAFAQMPRCNYWTLNYDDVSVDEKGAIQVKISNFTIKNPFYSIITGTFIQVCFPLTTSFINCPTLLQNVEYFYSVRSSLTLHNIYYNSNLPPNQYYISKTEVVNFCSNNIDTKFNYDYVYNAYGVAGFVSAASLVLAIVIKFNFFFQNYHCICLLCHIVSFVMLNVSYSVRKVCPNLDGVACYVMFTMYYYFTMATYSWLSVISYDSWRHISRLQTLEPNPCQCSIGLRVKNNALCRFVVFNVYAWGLPAILVAVILAINLFSSPYNFNSTFVPYIIPGCFLITWKTFAIYYWIPESVFTVITLVYLALSIRCIHLAGTGTELVNQNRRGQIFRLSIKMIIFMGICWPINCIFYFSSIINPELITFWLGTIAVTIIQGFVISALYCIRRETLTIIKALWRRTACKS